MAEVVITPDARAQAEELPGIIQLRMIELVRKLKNWPTVSGAKPLRGNLAGCYRLRTGDYRLQFRVLQTRKKIRVEKIGKKNKRIVEEHEVVEYRVIVEKVGHRDGFYEE